MQLDDASLSVHAVLAAAWLEQSVNCLSRASSLLHSGMAKTPFAAMSPAAAAAAGQLSGLDGPLAAFMQLLPRLAVCVVCAVACIRLCVWLRARSVLPSLLSRKLMHLITGPAYCSLWLLFPSAGATAPLSRYLVSLIPLCSAFYFLSVGVGWLVDDGLVAAVSRSGRRSELSRGPFLYGLLHWLACWLYWTDCAVGVQLLCILCIGDGAADVVGRWATQRGINRPLPWNGSKSVLGSASMMLGSLLSCAVLLTLYSACGRLPRDSLIDLTWSTGLLCAITTAVESLPLPDVDNLTVFAAGALTGHVLQLC